MHYFVANKVTEDEQKRAILLSVCGAATFKMIKSLSDSGRFPDTVTDRDLYTLVRNYLVIAQVKHLQQNGRQNHC
jgi:hypothetical protein